MSVITDVFEAVLGLMNTEDRTVLIGALPPDNSVAAYISGGGIKSTFLDKGFAYNLLVSLEAKNTAPQTALDTLNDIHQAVTQRKNYPTTEAYQITDVETVNSPFYVGREKNSQHVYGSTLRVKFYYKKGTSL